VNIALQVSTFILYTGMYKGFKLHAGCKSYISPCSFFKIQSIQDLGCSEKCTGNGLSPALPKGLRKDR